MIYLLFTIGLALSAVAAFYSIAGLMAIFAASALSIAIMGGVLEVAKLVIASWLYQNWKTAPKLLLAYFTSAVAILMLITSMGIFGYLSKAHLDQAVPIGDAASQVRLLDEKIDYQKQIITTNQSLIKQMDEVVNQTLSRTEDAKGSERALQIRRSQARDRGRLVDEIENAQKEVAKLNEERSPLASNLRRIEAEVGPIKYIAALIYDNAEQDMLEKAVRWVILLIVFVFDPLAVLMIIAANRELRKGNENGAGNPEPEPTGTGSGGEQAKDPEPSPSNAVVQEAVITEPSSKNNEELPVQAVEDIPVLENEETWAQRVIDESEQPRKKSLVESIYEKITKKNNVTSEVTIEKDPPVEHPVFIPSETTPEDFTASSDTIERLKRPQVGRPDRFKS
jgi:hypothetical protein